MAYQQKDFYFLKAKSQNYAARSIFKLEEIDKRFRLFKQGQKVLDLGAAPGSWSQYVSQRIGPQGKVLGIDLAPIKLTLANAVFIKADLINDPLDTLLVAKGIQIPFDVILSDMAPKTTGIRVTDQSRSLELCELALEISKKFLKPKGAFVCKLFHSEEFENFRKMLRTSFERVEVLRPKSTRKESKEIFFICLSFRT
jgi:23S rRNA (uridine2552-2'-O)-methyltransferase